MEVGAPGEVRPFTFTGLPDGLVGEIGARIEDDEDNIVQARSTAGFTEFAKGSYRKTFTLPEEAGFYVLIGDYEGEEAVQDFQVTTDYLALTPGPLNFVPTLDEIASHLRARLEDTNGNYLDTFTEDTIPSAAQVEEMRPAGVRKVASHVGVTICAGDSEETQLSLYGDARDLAALYIAMRIERSYFPAQVGSGRSPYKEMREEYDEAKATLIEAVGEHCGGGDGESVGGDAGSGAPAYSFPEANCWGQEPT